MAYTLVQSELIADNAITSAKLDTNIAVSGTLNVTGVTTLATHLVMGDNDKIKIGTGGDLEIYHDASNSYIVNSTGNLYIGDTNGNVHIQAKLNEDSIVATADGAVTLFHNNVAKLATASAGVTVTGVVTATSLDISGNIDVDGVTNLDVVDIDGAVDMASTLTVAGVLTGASLDISGDIDVDGTTNLDIVDIDGAVDMASTLTVGTKIFTGGMTLTNNDSGRIGLNRNPDTGASVNSSSLERHQINGAASSGDYLDFQNYNSSGTYVGGFHLDDGAFITVPTAGKHAVFNESGLDVDFRVESDGNANMLFVDGGNNKVGIGTSSPAYITEIAKSQAGGVGATLYLHNTADNSGVGHAAEIRFNLRNAEATTRNAAIQAIAEGTYGTSPALTFLTSSGDNGSATERLRIDSSGAIGIKKTPPSGTHTSWSQLFVGEKGSLISENANSGGLFGTWLTDNMYVKQSTGAFANITTDQSSAYSQEAGIHRWFTHASGNANAAITLAEKMRIDTSGRLLVGLTGASGFGQLEATTLATSGQTILARTSGTVLVGKTSTAFGTAGAALYASGDNDFVNNGNVLSLNRLSADGSIINIYRDSSLKGSINIHSSTLQIGTGNTQFAFSDADDAFFVKNAAGTARNGSHDLGKTNARFKDLYLSGGVHLGGTGTANKLDDYEEGTWTPASISGISLTVNAAVYTKIGRVVHIGMAIVFASNSNSAAVQIAGLPFPVRNQSDQAYGATIANTDVGRENIFFSFLRNSSIIGIGNSSNADVPNSVYSGKKLCLSGFYFTDA